MAAGAPALAKPPGPILPAKSRGTSLYGLPGTGRVVTLRGANANVVLATLLAAQKIAAGDVTLAIAPGAVLYATTTGTYALDCAGIPALVRLAIVNFGTIGGCGGAGGTGGYWAQDDDLNWYYLHSSPPSVYGGAGGPAIRLGGRTTLKNLGRIYGGGNGGNGTDDRETVYLGGTSSPGGAGATTTASGPVAAVSNGSTWGVNGAAIVKNGYALSILVPGDILGGVA